MRWNFYDEMKYIVCSPAEITDLLATTEVTSSDYNTVKALVQGDIDTFMGFKFIESNRLLTDDSGNTLCYVYVPSAVELCIAKEFELTADRLPERRNAVGFQAQMAMGATRLEEERIVEIACA